MGVTQKLLASRTDYLTGRVQGPGGTKKQFKAHRHPELRSQARPKRETPQYFTSQHFGPGVRKHPKDPVFWPHCAGHFLGPPSGKCPRFILHTAGAKRGQD